MPKKNKNYAMFIPCKSFGAVLTGLFFVLFPFLSGNAQTIEPNNFTISFRCEELPETDTTILKFSNEYEYINFDYYQLPTNIEITFEDYVLNSGSINFVANSWVDFTEYKTFKIAYCGDKVTAYYEGKPVDYLPTIADPVLTTQFNDTMDLEIMDACVQDLQILNYCEIEEIGTTTPQYDFINNDIGVITGTNIFWNGTGTTTQYLTYKIPAILYFFIFSIVAVIITIIIAWAYKR